jgi:flagellar hook-length control protein FliK
MQIRELLKSQQILAPLVSAKNTSQQSEWDAFSQLLANKNEKVTEKPHGSNDPYQLVNKRNNDNPKVLKETSLEKKFNVKVDVSVTTGHKSSEVTESQTAHKEIKKSETAPKETKAKSSKDDDVSNETGKLKAALKAKLKKDTGLSDAQLDQLLATMQLNVESLKQMLAGGEASTELFAELAETIESLDIDEALEKNLAGNDLNHLQNQMDKLLKTLEKLVADSSKDEAGDNVETLSKALPFEMKIVQALSKIMSELNKATASPDDAVIRPEDIRKAIMQAISPIQTDTQNESKTDSAPVTSAPNVANVSSMQSSASDSSMNGEETNGQSTPQTVVSTSAQVQAGTIQNITGQPTEALKQDATQTEAEVKTNEGVSMHQVAMKQGNSVTTAAIQQTPQLKQEIFTQIMDAVKGQIKLTDHGTSLLVKLQPEQLGNVELKLNIHKGIVLAEIKVENEIVKAAIESNLDDLKQSLSNKGYSVDQINVNVDSGKKDRQEAFEFNQQEKQNRKNQKNEEIGNLEPIETSTKYIVDEYESSTINYYG